MQVVDLANLHPGISEYYRASSTLRYSGLKSLNLMHYTGQTIRTDLFPFTCSKFVVRTYIDAAVVNVVMSVSLQFSLIIFKF